MDLLREIICDGVEDGCIGHCNHPYCHAVNKVAEKLLETNFVQLPVKPGQEAYYIFEGNDEKLMIAKGKVVTITFEEHTTWIYCCYSNGLTFHHTTEDIGKDLFFNKEEAKEFLDNFKE